MDQTPDPISGSEQSISHSVIAPDPLNAPQRHPTLVEFRPSIPSEVEVGADVTFTITVACPSRCELRDRPVILTANSSVTTSRLTSFDGSINATENVTVQAPAELGDYVFSAIFPRDKNQDGIHEESSVSVALRTKPHQTSVAVWDIPSPVVMNAPFTVKVGIRCATGCRLTGNLVEISDDLRGKLGEGRLAATLWPGTESLYWAEVTLTAPAEEGVFFLNAGLGRGGSGFAHDAALGRFSCRTARPPEHTVSIAVTAKVTRRPIADVEVRVGHYEGFTDDRGVATLELPTGTYGLSIRKDGFMAEPLTVDIHGNLTIPIEASTAVSKALAESPVGPHHPYRD